MLMKRVFHIQIPHRKTLISAGIKWWRGNRTQKSKKKRRVIDSEDKETENTDTNKMKTEEPKKAIIPSSWTRKETTNIESQAGKINSSERKESSSDSGVGADGQQSQQSLASRETSVPPTKTDPWQEQEPSEWSSIRSENCSRSTRVYWKANTRWVKVWS